MKLFRKGYDITLKRIKDTVRIKENGETLVLTVSADPMRIVSGLAKAQDKLLGDVFSPLAFSGLLWVA